MKPTLGYPSRIDAICALRREGKTEGEIAALIGIRPNTVTSMEARAKDRGTFETRAQRLSLSQCVLMDLQEEADRRRITPARLVENLLSIISRDDLFAAVLEDEGSDNG